MTEDIFKGYGIHIELLAKRGTQGSDQYKDSFHVVKETLTRIGIASEKTKTLYQTCHILHKRGRYAILHFKELFALDGKPAEISPDDLQRREGVVKLLSEWGLIKVPDRLVDWDKPGTQPHLRIISYADKKNWTLKSKYTIGQKRS
jgi:hypothetical protein